MLGRLSFSIEISWKADSHVESRKRAKQTMRCQNILALSRIINEHVIICIKYYSLEEKNHEEILTFWSSGPSLAPSGRVIGSSKVLCSIFNNVLMDLTFLGCEDNWWAKLTNFRLLLLNSTSNSMRGQLLGEQLVRNRICSSGYLSSNHAKMKTS